MALKRGMRSRQQFSFLSQGDTPTSRPATWHAFRARVQAKVAWQFTTGDARVKLKRLHPTLDR